MQVQFNFDGPPFGSALPGRYADTNASRPDPNPRWRPKAVLQNSILIQVEVHFRSENCDLNSIPVTMLAWISISKTIAEIV